MTIDICCPTYSRPNRVSEFIQSIKDTASDLTRINIILCIDLEQEAMYRIDFPLPVAKVFTGKEVLSELWNKCYRMGTGDILMHASDDIIFETQGWDEIVREYFRENPIGMIYGRDGHQDENCATHSFTSRKAADILGYFCPPYFEADWNDVWLMEMYRKIGKLKYEPRIMTRHLHVNVNEKFDDETYQIARERRQRASKVWSERNHEIETDAEKLRAHL